MAEPTGEEPKFARSERVRPNASDGKWPWDRPGYFRYNPIRNEGFNYLSEQAAAALGCEGDIDFQAGIHISQISMQSLGCFEHLGKGTHIPNWQNALENVNTVRRRLGLTGETS